MNSLQIFEMHAEIYAVFWFLFCLYSVWKTRKSYDERIAEVEKAIDDMFSLVKFLPFPKLLPGLFVGVWIFCTIIDVIGVALLFSVINRIDWVVKVLTMIVLLATINDLRELIGSLQAMDDEQHLREKMLSKTHRRAMRILDIETWARFLLSLILLIGVLF